MHTSILSSTFAGNSQLGATLMDGALLLGSARNNQPFSPLTTALASKAINVNHDYTF
jgi:hypothetical protein